MAAVFGVQASPAWAIAPQTLTDPTGDNCRDYPNIGNWCGPDITQAVFSTPGDGNLHVNVVYATLPLSGTIQETVDSVEVGIYPKTSMTPQVLGVPGAFRLHRNPSSGLWTLQTHQLKVVAGVAVTATAGPLNIDLAVSLAGLGDPAAYRYAVNAGSTGETIPEHPDLAPNSGLFDLVGDAAPPAPPPAPAPAPSPLPAPSAPALRALSLIPAVQRGNAITGQVEATVGGDLTVEGFVPAASLAAKSKLRSIGKVTKRGVKAGKVSFRLALKAAARKQLAGRRTPVTLRITLKPASGNPVIQSRRVTLTVPR